MTLPRLEDLEGLGPGTRVLVRLDLNVPVKEGAVMDATRVEAALPTLRWLIARGAVIAACSHLGKAAGTPDPRFSLAPVASVLSGLLEAPVRFVEDCVGGPVEEALALTPAGGVVLLENLRFHPGEKANDLAFANQLAAPFSHYVNDAFGTAHRAHASVEAAPRLFERGRRAAGRLMARELEALGRVVHHPAQPFVAVVGGAKVSTKTGPLRSLVERAATVLIGGGMANTFLLARGLEVGRSLVEEEMVPVAREVVELARAREVELLLPEDLVVADSLDSPSRVETVPAHAVPPELMAVDIGPATVERFRAALARASTVFWNGPMGVFEVDAFARGTLAVAQALASCPGFTVVGGGESVMAVHRAGVAERIDHVSTGGGASLKLVAGERLPALAALED